MTSTLRTLPLAVALVVSVLLTSFALTLSPRVAEAATTPDYRACPDVLVLGARGSSESPQNWTSSSAFTRDPFLGLGENVYGVYDRLMRSAPHLRIEARAVQYVASPVPANPLLQPAFLESVRGGVLLLVNQVKYVERTCTGANVRYVFAGYSQGAWVVQGALAQLQALPGVSRRTVGVVQFGNPHFLPAGQEVVRFKAENTLAGLATRHYTRIPLPEGFKTKTASYCLPKDPVCQMWPTRGAG